MGRCYSPGFGDMADSFDSLFEDVERLTELEGEALDRILSKYGVQSVLDCACGTGIQSIGLAESGYRVSASDISRKMVDLLGDKASRRGIEIEVKCADFRDLRPWGEACFDAVICSGNSLTLVPRSEEVVPALKSMVRVTKSPGGVGIVGLHNYDKLRREGKQLLVRRADIQATTPELLLDLRSFGADRVEITYMTIRFLANRWRVKTRAKSYLCLSAEDLRRAMLDAGYRKVYLLDISGQRPFQDDEWVLAVGTT